MTNPIGDEESTPKRKVIQITTSAISGKVYFYTLCDDGTMWRRSVNHGWVQVDPVPGS